MSKFFEDTMQGLLESVEMKKGNIPNADTLKAMAEVEFMIEHPELPHKTYNDVDKMFEDILAED